ncbi:MAG: GNAT family N-acetyltransferase [Pseudomonadota bacterium]
MPKDIVTAAPVPTARAIELHQRLADAGQTLTPAQMPEFLLYIEGEDGRMIAGCKGELTFQTAHLSELWVDASARGAGLGTRLLSEAE